MGIENRSLKISHIILDVMNEGIIAIKENGIITIANEKAIKLLKLKARIEGNLIEVKEIRNNFSFNGIYEIKLNNKVYEVIGKQFINNSYDKEWYKILIFNSLRKREEEKLTLQYGINTTRISNIIGDSPQMQILKNNIKKLSNLNSTILITGESGTGKELVARAIHAEGNKKNQPFIAINCGAIPEALLESELFGYVKGAFSGADANGRIGKFELANNGVIFLDEIGDMPLYLQVKLLRVLQERAIIRIGSNKLIPLNLRVIAATNKNLSELIQKGEFREDLYYRLNVIPIEVPPLRHRDGDIELLVKVLIYKYNLMLNKNVRGIDKEAIKIMKQYKWQGNVRELENVVEFMVTLAENSEILDKSMFPSSFNRKLMESTDNRDDILDNIITLKELESIHIQRALNKYGRTTEGKKNAANKLGIGIATLYRKIDNLNILSK